MRDFTSQHLKEVRRHLYPKEKKTLFFHGKMKDT